MTVKTGENKTIGDIENKIFLKVGLKLCDNNALKEYELNGSIRKMTAFQWEDLNRVYIGIEGYNKLIIRDTSDNEAIYEFTLIK